jgi:hypothetical protein
MAMGERMFMVRKMGIDFRIYAPLKCDVMIQGGLIYILIMIE